MYFRIRQHNGEVKGGAKYTRSWRPYYVEMLVVGFLGDHRAALKFEKHLQCESRRTKKKYSLQDRLSIAQKVVLCRKY